MQLWFKGILPNVILFCITKIKSQSPPFYDKVVLTSKCLSSYVIPEISVALQEILTEILKIHLKTLYFEDTEQGKDNTLK
jgi:hypothetical protein